MQVAYAVNYDVIYM